MTLLCNSNNLKSGKILCAYYVCIFLKNAHKIANAHKLCALKYILCAFNAYKIFFNAHKIFFNAHKIFKNAHKILKMHTFSKNAHKLIKMHTIHEIVCIFKKFSCTQNFFQNL